MKHTIYATGKAMFKTKAILLLFAVFLAATISCSKDENITDEEPYDRIQPSGPKPSWGPTINPQMQTVIEELDGPSPTPLYLLTPQQARQQPTAADAVKKVMQKFAIPMPPMNVDTMGKDIPVKDGTIHLRIYTPKTGKSSYPLIVYYHGGGWVIATIDTYDASAQALAEQVDAVVVSVEYRKGPEFKFPTAHKDSYAAYKWAVQNAASIKADAARVATAGESAGGNLAVNMAIMARDSSFTVPKHIMAVYPVANNDLNAPSYIQYADAHPLSKPLVQWFIMHYLNNMAESANPMISLVNANLSGLPSTTIINAEIDPLLSDGELLAAKLQAVNVPVVRQVYTGVTHEFFGMATVVREAKDAQALAAQRLKQALGN